MWSVLVCHIFGHTLTEKGKKQRTFRRYFWASLFLELLLTLDELQGSKLKPSPDYWNLSIIKNLTLVFFLKMKLTAETCQRDQVNWKENPDNFFVSTANCFIYCNKQGATFDCNTNANLTDKVPLGWSPP